MPLMSSRLWQKMTRIRRKRSSSLRRAAITLYLALFPPEARRERWFVVSWPAETANWRICHRRDEFGGKLIDRDLPIGPRNCQFTRCNYMPRWLPVSPSRNGSPRVSFANYPVLIYLLCIPNDTNDNLETSNFHFFVLLSYLPYLPYLNISL